ncbi:hypothetical protein BDZ91DRAFT_2172 [Kalaharituber pfeilii]|nr:hypothetical protein BDZ91DRAFT_2172 [Kalaharituber pfeilii]
MAAEIYPFFVLLRAIVGCFPYSSRRAWLFAVVCGLYGSFPQKVGFNTSIQIAFRIAIRGTLWNPRPNYPDFLRRPYYKTGPSGDFMYPQLP